MATKTAERARTRRLHSGSEGQTGSVPSDSPVLSVVPPTPEPEQPAEQTPQTEQPEQNAEDAKTTLEELLGGLVDNALQAAPVAARPTAASAPKPPGKWEIQRRIAQVLMDAAGELVESFDWASIETDTETARQNLGRWLNYVSAGNAWDERLGVRSGAGGRGGKKA